MYYLCNFTDSSKAAINNLPSRGSNYKKIFPQNSFEMYSPTMYSPLALNLLFYPRYIYHFFRKYNFL